MMNSSVGDDFPANPFRIDDQAGGDPFAQPPAGEQQQQQPQFNQQPPPPVQQQQQQQFNQQPPMQQQQQNGNINNNNNMGGAMDPTTPQSTPTSYYGMCMACFKLDSYKRYFDIDTDDIQKRMIAAMTHFHQPQYFRDQVVGPEVTVMSMNDGPANTDLKGPDLYGPVWITFVLILLVAATANWSASLHSKSDIAEFEYDITHLLHAWTFMTAFVFGAPTIFWLSTRCMSLNALTWAEWVCYYGYSMVPFLPATLLCIIPINFIAWIVLLAASGASGLLILRNASTPLLASDPTAQKAPPMILAILATHFIFFISMGITFYHHRKPKSLT